MYSAYVQYFSDVEIQYHKKHNETEYQDYRNRAVNLQIMHVFRVGH